MPALNDMRGNYAQNCSARAVLPCRVGRRIAPPSPPQIRTYRTTVSGSSRIIIRCPPCSCYPVRVGETVCRLQRSVRSVDALGDDARLPLPYSGSFGPQFATYLRYYGALRRLLPLSASPGCPLSADTVRFPVHSLPSKGWGTSLDGSEDFVAPALPAGLTGLIHARSAQISQVPESTLCTHALL